MATSPWYREGTAKFTQGSTTVTGTGTRWVDFVRAGDGIQGPDGKLYQVTNVASNTSMSITPAYGNETTYWTIPIQGYVKRLADAASQLVRDVEGGAVDAIDAADRAKQSATEASASEAAALSQANRAESEADRAKTEADRAQQAADDAVSVVTNGGGSIDPAPGKWPVAGSDATIKSAWVHELDFALDKLRVATNKALYGDGPYPALDFQFQGANMLDPRIQFTRASADWDWDGKEYGIDEPVLTDQGLWTSGARTNLLLSSKRPWLSPWHSGGSAYFVRQYTEETGPIEGAQIAAYGPEDGRTSFSPSITAQNVSLQEGKYSLSGYLKSENPNHLIESPSVRTLHRTIPDISENSYGGGTVSRLHGVGGVDGDPTNTGSGAFGVSKVVKCEPVGNGWYFYHEVIEMVEPATVQIRLFPYASRSSFIGDGQTGVLRTALQLEAGEVATSYIPTEDSQVTVAPSFQSVPKQLKGDYTVFVDFTPIAPATRGSITGIFSIFKSTTNAVTVTLYAGIIRLNFYGQGSIIPSNISFEYGQRHKIAITLRDDKVWFFVNGEMILADHGLTNSIINDFDTLLLGSHDPTATITRGATFFHAVSVFDKNLTDEQLQELTSL